MTPNTFSKKIVKKIAIGYAYSRDSFYSYQTQQEYAITRYTFDRILERAVIEHIVSMDVVEKMRSVAKSHAGAGATNRTQSFSKGNGAKHQVDEHYNRLIAERKVYVPKAEKRKEIIDSWLKSSNKNLAFLFSEFCIDDELFKRIVDAELKAGQMSEEKVLELIKSLKSVGFESEELEKASKRVLHAEITSSSKCHNAKKSDENTFSGVDEQMSMFDKYGRIRENF